MKILYVTQYFHPEVGATTNRALANVRYLANEGHDVTILTEMPNHPKGIIFSGYQGKIFVKEQMENYHVNRVWVYTSPKKNFITRILFYITFVKMSIFWLIFNWKKYDVVYVTSPPLFVGIIGLFTKKFFPSSKFVFEVRDLWPDAAIEMGALKNKYMAKFSYSLENSLYKNADHLVPVTERFRSKIIDKGFPASKMTVIRNGSDPEFRKVDVSEELRIKFDKDNKFIIVYAGNLGIAQNLTTILKAAILLSEEDILFLLLGSGPEENLLKQYHKKHNIKNVIFVGEVAKKDVSKYLSIADCGIIPLKNIPVFSWTIPSKLFDYMAAELPVLLGVKGEACEILTDAEAGIPFEPDNPSDLKDKILYMKNNPDILTEMAQNGKNTVIEKFDRRKLAKKLDSVIQKVTC